MLRDGWAGIVGRIGRISVMAQAPLRDARPVAVDGDNVTIAFDPEFEGEIDDFKSARNRGAVEHVLGEVLKRQIRADFTVMAETPGPDLQISPGREAPERTPAGAGGAAGQQADKGSVRDKREWSKEPPVRKVVDMFGGKVVGTRE